MAPTRASWRPSRPDWQQRTWSWRWCWETLVPRLTSGGGWLRWHHLRMTWTWWCWHWVRKEETKAKPKKKRRENQRVSCVQYIITLCWLPPSSPLLPHTCVQNSTGLTVVTCKIHREFIINTEQDRGWSQGKTRQIKGKTGEDEGRRGTEAEEDQDTSECLS